jgi:hypothetical protein
MGQMPGHIKVGRSMYTVHCSKETWHDYTQESAVNQHDHGASQHHKLVILVNPSDHPHQQADTLLHEVLHCIWFQANMTAINPPEESHREEITISQLTPWLTMALADNPKLALFIHNPQE